MPIDDELYKALLPPSWRKRLDERIPIAQLLAEEALIPPTAYLNGYQSATRRKEEQAMCNCQPKGVVSYEDPNKLILEGHAIELNTSNVLIVRNGDNRDIITMIEQMGALGYEGDESKAVPPVRITIEKINQEAEEETPCNCTHEHSQRAYDLLIYLNTLLRVNTRTGTVSNSNLDLQERLKRTCEAIEDELTIG